MRLTLYLFIAASFVPLALGTCGTCSLSGDQHFLTLDGAEHHYYGRGWHRLYQLDRFEVQCLFADCKTGAETIDGHRRRNDGRRICLRACRAQFVPPGNVCPQVVNWEPLALDVQGQSQIEVNGARLQSGKGISQAAKDQSWWLRIERVGKDAAALDVMLGGGAGGVALRLGPKRIVTVTVKGLQGGRGLCGSCDGINSNDLAGATHLNVSDCDGHNRFADAHRRGAAGFALIPVKPTCAGGNAIKEDDEVARLLKDAEAAKEEELSAHSTNEQLIMLGSDMVQEGDPDNDANLVVPPVATFANATLLETVVRDCQAGMIVTATDERMKVSIDNCVLDKARGRGFELAAASNVVAYVQSLMISEQSDLALQRISVSKNFCAMCQSAIQTFVVDTKPILRHLVDKQAHWFDPGAATYTALVPAPFELLHPELTPRPTKFPPLSNLSFAMNFPKPIIMPEKNASIPSLSALIMQRQNASTPNPSGTDSSIIDGNSTQSAAAPITPGESESVANTTDVQKPEPEPETPSSNNSTETQPQDNPSTSEPPSLSPTAPPSPSSASPTSAPPSVNPTSAPPSVKPTSAPPSSSPTKPKSSDDSSTTKPKDDPKKSKSGGEAESGKYHLKGGSPVSNEDDDDDKEKDDDAKTRRDKKGKVSKKNKKKDSDDDDDSKVNKRKSKSDGDSGDAKKKAKSDDTDADKSNSKPKDGNDAKKDSRSEAPPSPEPKVETPEPTPPATRAPIIPGSSSDSPAALAPNNAQQPSGQPITPPTPLPAQPPSSSPPPSLPSNEPTTVPEQRAVAEAITGDDNASTAYPVIIRATPVDL